jgi:uncharacterized RDD family membrane protein YckC
VGVDRDRLSRTALRVVRSAGWRRVAARAVDTALMTAPMVGIFIWANGYYHRNSPGAVEDYAVLVYVLAAAASLAWAVVGWTLYEYFTTANTGRTLGKWLFGLRVMRAGGAPIGPWRAFGRAIVAMVTSLTCIPLAFLFNGIGLFIWVAALVLPVLFSRRSFVDLIVETCVVRSPRTRRERVMTKTVPVLEN